MTVRHHVDGDKRLSLPRGGNRDAPLAWVVVTGRVGESRVDGARVTLVGHNERRTAV